MKRGFFASFAVAVLAALFATQALAADAVQRGGTLKGMFATDVDFIDPSLAYYQHSWQIMGATGANLLRFADAEGSAGSRLVPEVAAGFPTVSQGRQDVHVHAAEHVQVLERQARHRCELRLGDQPRAEQPAAVARRAVRRRRRRRPGGAGREGPDRVRSPRPRPHAAPAPADAGGAGHPHPARDAVLPGDRHRHPDQRAGRESPARLRRPVLRRHLDSERAPDPQAEPELHAGEEPLRDEARELRHDRVRREHQPRRAGAADPLRPGRLRGRGNLARRRTPTSRGSSGSTGASTRCVRSRSRTTSRSTPRAGSSATPRSGRRSTSRSTARRCSRSAATWPASAPTRSSRRASRASRT